MHVMASGAPIVVPGAKCFAAPVDSSCVDIGFTEGPFGSLTDDRAYSVVSDQQLFGGPGIRADNGLFGPTPPPRSWADDFVDARVELWNDGTNDVLTAKVSGQHALLPGSLGAGPAESSIGAQINVTGRLESSTATPGTVLRLPIQIDHDGGISGFGAPIQEGSSVAILWEANATLFTFLNGGAQTPLFSGSLAVNEQSNEIGTIGFSASGYSFSDVDGDGFAESYANSTPFFSEVQLKVGEKFTLQLLVGSRIFSNDGNPTFGDRLGHAFPDTFSVGLVLPPGTTFVPIPEPATFALALLGTAILLPARRR